MLPDWFVRTLVDARRTTRPATARRRQALTRLERLEGRTLFASVVWDGTLDTAWTNPGNWDTTSPADGDDVTFKANPTGTATNNDGAPITLSGMTFQGTGYSLTGSAVTLTGGITDTSAGTNAISLGLVLDAGNTAIDVATGGTLALSGGIGETSLGYGLTKTGGGRLTLAGVTATYSGLTSVDGGSLLVDGAAIGGIVTVNNGGTLLGTGTLGGLDLATGGNLAPGVSGPGTLSTGPLSMVSGVSVSFDLNGATAGSGYDQVDVTGSVDLGGATLTASLGYAPAVGDQLTIVSNDGADAVAGTFAGLAEGAVVDLGGERFRISYQGGTGNDVVMTRLAASSTAVDSATNPTVSGEGTTFTVTVSGSSGTPTGNVTLLDGVTSLGTAALDGAGEATFAVSSLGVGSRSITAVYDGNATYDTSTSAALTQTVNKADSAAALGSSAAPSVFGQAVTLTATLTATAPGAGTPTGTVTFMDGATTLGTGTLDGSGVATLGTSALATGSHSITVTYAGDGSFNGATSSAFTQTVNQASTGTTLATSATPTVTGESVTFTANVSATAPGAGTPSGTVTFMDGATTLGTGTLTGGQATLTTTALPAGSYNVTAVYGGDTNFVTSTSAATTQTVDQAGTTAVVSSSNAAAVVGESVTFTATVAAAAPGSGTPTGTVTFKNGAATLGTGTLDGAGQATFDTSALGIGNHTITVEYAGDDNYVASTSAGLTQSVGMASTATTLASDINPSAFGQSVTFTAGVTPVAPGSGTPTGTMTFMEGATVLGTGTLNGSGVATFATAALTAGSHSVTAVYGGDSNFGTSTSAAVSQTVDQAATTAAVTSSDGGSGTYGEATTFTATMAVVAPGAGTPTGTVTFKDGATTLGTGTLDGSGEATFTTSDLAVGSHAISVVYGGDANFQGATSADLTQVVAKGDVGVTVSTFDATTVYGEGVTLTATVAATGAGPAAPGGTVEFFSGSDSLGFDTVDGSGEATVDVDDLAVATHDITAVYSGDTNYNGASSTAGTVSQTVAQAATTVTLTSPAATSVTGESVTFTATMTVTAPGTGTPTGSVTFEAGGTVLDTVTLAGGVAQLVVGSLTVGNYTITASYNGDTNFTGSDSAGLAHEVTPAATAVSLATSVPAGAVVGQEVTFTATVSVEDPGSGTPTGTVAFMEGATTLGTGTLSGGVATFATSGLTLGSHDVKAVYQADTQFSGSESTVLAQQVGQAGTTTVVSSDDTSSRPGQSVTLTADVSVAAPGAGTPGGTVEFFNDGVSLGAPVALDGDGRATLDVSTLAIGTHPITAVYSGDTDFTTSTSLAMPQSVGLEDTETVVTSAPATPVYGQTVTLTATVTPAAGGPVTGTVTFFEGVTPLGAAATVNDAGVATFETASLGAGDHTITAVYSGDDAYATSTSADFTQTIGQAATGVTVAGSAATTAFGDGVTLTATVAVTAPGAGVPTGTVEFFAGTDSLGTQPLTGGTASIEAAALAVGGHTITAVYSGDADFEGSGSAGLAHEVTLAPTTVALAALSTVFYGQTANLGVMVLANNPDAGVPTGTVEFFDGETSLGSAGLDANGIASLGADSLSIGSHTITATYSGDGSRATSTSESFTLIVANNAPTVTGGIGAVTVDEDAADTAVGLAPAFADVEDGDGEMTFTVVTNSNPGLFTSADVSGGTLTLGYTPNASGTAVVTVRATDTAGLWVETSFTVTVNPVQDPGALQFSPAVYTPGEGSGSFQITVTRTGGTEGVVGASYFVTGGSAAANADFTLAAGTVSFGEGEATKTITVTVTDDALDEDAETIVVTLTAPTGGAALGNNTSTIATITDNDAPPTISVADVTVVEGSGGGSTAANFVVTLSAPSGKTVGVSFSTAGISAASGVDFVATSGTISFEPGETTQTVMVSVNADAIGEPGETFFLNLSSPQNAEIADGQGWATITNDDNFPPTAMSTNETVRPGAGLRLDGQSFVNDPDDDVLTFGILVPPTNGTARIDDGGTPTDPSDDDFVYEPNPGAHGTDSFVYQVDDGRGGVATGTVNVETIGAGLSPSPLYQGVQDLIVIGTPGDDNIRIYAGKKKGEIKVMINNESWGNHRVTGRVLAFGGEGNDTIQLKYVNTGAVFYGGPGDDRLDGAGGLDVLLGGPGDDRLDGKQKRDLLIGGTGADRMAGGTADDILIGGTTSYDADTDANRLALYEILAAWNKPGKVGAKMNAIKAGVGTTDAHLGLDTVQGDGVADQLGGKSGKNWIFGDTPSGVTADVLQVGRRNDTLAPM